MKDYKFIEEARNARKTPPPSAWDRIEKQLDATQPIEESKETKVFSMWKWTSVAAACVAVVAIVSTLSINNKEQYPVDKNYMVSVLEENNSSELIYSKEYVSKVHAAYKGYAAKKS